MASGGIVGFIGAPIPPTTLSAGLTTRNDGSSPVNQNPIWAFDASTIEYLDFRGVLNGYDGGGLTLRLKWSAASATSGDTVWGAAIRRIADDAEDMDSAHTYDYNDSTVTAASVSGEVDYAAITFTSGADMDSLADGEAFILRIRRNAISGSDTMTGDAELWSDFVTLEET